MGAAKGPWSAESSNVRQGSVLHEDDRNEEFSPSNSCADSNNNNIVFTNSSSDSNNNNNAFSVLVVDDDIETRKMNELLLNSSGFDVQGVDNGQQAIDLHTIGESFNLILMDIDMPVKNGFQATKELRDMGVYCAIVGITPRDEDEDVINNFLKVALDGCIRKPLTIEKISPFLSGDPYVDDVYSNDDDDDNDNDMDVDQCSIVSSCSSNSLN